MALRSFAVTLSGSMLLAVACYDSDASGGEPPSNPAVTCESFCNAQIAQGCLATVDAEQCAGGCATALQQLGTCGEAWRVVMQCAVSRGFSCDQDGTIYTHPDCASTLQAYADCIGRSFDAGS